MPSSVEFAAELIITAELNSARSTAKKTPAIAASFTAALFGGLCAERDASAHGTNTSCAMAMRQKADVQPGTPDHRTNSADHPIAKTPSASTAYARGRLMPAGLAAVLTRARARAPAPAT